jgi:hypothetical protein
MPHPEDGGSMDLRNVGVLPQYHTVHHNPEDLIMEYHRGENIKTRIETQFACWTEILGNKIFLCNLFLESLPCLKLIIFYYIYICWTASL